MGDNFFQIGVFYWGGGDVYWGCWKFFLVNEVVDFMLIYEGGEDGGLDVLVVKVVVVQVGDGSYYVGLDDCDV